MRKNRVTQKARISAAVTGIQTQRDLAVRAAPPAERRGVLVK